MHYSNSQDRVNNMGKLRSLTSNKHLQIDKANSVMVVSTGIAAVMLVFSLMATKALWTQASFKKKIIKEKQVAVTQLKANVEAVSSLDKAYQEFVKRPTNAIGGGSTGDGDRDGDNAKIILDALPSKYDFPALVSSFEKILSGNDYKVSSISGIDDEVAQSLAKVNGEPIEVPFQIAVSGPYGGVQGMIKTLESSIRPMKVDQITFSGSDADISASVVGKTYFLPEKSINIQMKEIKQ